MTPRQRAEMRLADAEWRARRYGFSFLGKPLFLRIFYLPYRAKGNGFQYEKRDGLKMDRLDAVELVLGG